MAATIADITIGQTWVDVNTVSGITVGVAFSISNKGNGEILAIESTTTPAADSKDGIPITTNEQGYAERYIPTNSLKIWCKARSSTIGSTITVQLV